MSTGAALLLVASIISAESGAAVIDQGSVQGLRPGDEGQLFYALTVNDTPKRIEAGSASILDVEETTASIQAAPGAQLRPGYEIEFRLPTSRMTGSPLEQRSSELTPQLLKRPAPLPAGEGLAPSSGSDADSAPAPQPSESTKPAPPIEAAEPSPRPLKRPAPLPAGEGRAPSRDSDTDTVPSPSPVESARAVPSREAVLIPAGRYSIGRDLLTAEFHNQTPRFEVEIGAITIDRRPVTVEQYLAAGNSPIGEQSSTDYVRAITWLEAEAYCRSVGGRLLSEFEWEIAVQQADVGSPSGLLEWTGSWYSPYPGNVHPEEQFGTTYRVLRGGPSGATFDPHARRFMAPDQRNSSVGFRCASADGEM